MFINMYFENLKNIVNIFFSVVVCLPSTSIYYFVLIYLIVPVRKFG